LIKSKEATEHVLPVKCYRNVNSRNQLNLNLKAAIKCAFKTKRDFSLRCFYLKQIQVIYLNTLSI
jgi:hypothetical protein